MEKKEVTLNDVINLVHRDIAAQGLAKDQKNIQQKYAYRGIDGLYNLISPILVKHGLIIAKVGESLIHNEYRSTERSTAQHVIIHTVYQLRSTHCTETLNIEANGGASDYSDKAISKAQSMAFKYLLIQLFAIPTGETEVDADSTSPTIPSAAPLDANTLDALKKQVAETAQRTGISTNDLWKKICNFVGVINPEDIQQSSLQVILAKLHATKGKE